MLSNYSDIQNRIDYLYDTKWFQPNAFYPTVFFYTDKSISDNDYTVDNFLKMHVNSNPTKTVYLDKNVQRKTALENLDNTPKTLQEYTKLEEKLEKTGISPSESVLRQFIKIDGLKIKSLPLSKSQNSLTSSGKESEGATVKLEFLCDRDFHVLRYLQAWQSRWYTNDFQKKALASKSVDSEDIKNNNLKDGGEGYFGLSNCLVDINGNITTLSHLSLFGLIPKTITVPSSFGPQANVNEIPKIAVDCIYAHAILTYPSEDRLNFYYYD